mmetsp:Transcript_20791/g.47809  ORF Transcript_20791/g.47809 Transcript_20791/m.47809 type:complete len:176 (-) Transcript_20791:97-624(-)|eukprot:3151147-Amphidinium_carterae.2
MGRALAVAAALCLGLMCVSPLVFVQPGTGARDQPGLTQGRAAVEQATPLGADARPSVLPSSAVLAMSLAVGVMLGFVKAADAMVDYSGLAYLGGSDKVDINNANVQAYRQFPGMYPTIAGLIGSNGPYKSVSDIYNVKGLTEPMKSVLKQYEANLVCFPADPAYFIDRVNNGLYR